MEYKKPQVVAQNSTEGSYAAGCPEIRPRGSTGSCTRCELKY